MTLDLNTTEKYIKNVDIVNLNKVMSSRLPQSKLYLKILGILYYITDTNLPITTDIVEKSPSNNSHLQQHHLHLLFLYYQSLFQI